MNADTKALAGATTGARMNTCVDTSVDACTNSSAAGMTGIVFMASGQGSQKPGMGASLLHFDQVKEIFDCASDILGRDISALVQQDDEHAANTLNETKNAQAAIAALSIGIGKLLLSRGIQPCAFLGFSLGQISALALSGMISTEDAFRIIDVRSRLMDEAAKQNPGAMSALLKADEKNVELAIEAAAQGETLCIANYNCPGQIVISGTKDAISRAEEAWSAQGLLFSRLATQGAFHSPLMQPACDEFAQFLANISFSEPSAPLICNTDAEPLTPQAAPEHLVKHLTHPVRFKQSVSLLANRGAQTFVETGFGGVLTGLVKRIDRKLERFCVQDEASLNAFLEAKALE